MQNIADIKDISALTFDEHVKLLEELNRRALQNPQAAPSLLPDFYRLLDGHATEPAIKDVIARTFFDITRTLSKEETVAVINRLDSIGKQEVVRLISDKITDRNPACAEEMFRRQIERIKNTPADYENDFIDIAIHLRKAIAAASDEDAAVMFAQTETLPESVRKHMFSQLSNLYDQKNVLRDVIWDKIINLEPKDVPNLGALYDVLSSAALQTNERQEACLNIVRTYIATPKQSAADMSCVTRTLIILRDNPACRNEVDKLLDVVLKNPNTSKRMKKEIYRTTGNVKMLTSHATIGQRVEKTAENSYGFKIVENVPPDQPVLLVLGGTGTFDNAAANGYLSTVQKLLQHNDIKDQVALYGAVYDFGAPMDYQYAFDHMEARRLLFQKHHHAAKAELYNNDTLDPAYVEDLFKNIFLARISDKDGKPLSVNEACSRMRKTTVFAHCHGAYTFLKLEEKIQDKMRELGYTNEEREKILQELVCVAHAPHAPLAVSKATMISFVSAQDKSINHYNNFTTDLWRLPKDEVLMSYFPGKRGELIMAPTLGDVSDQHTFAGFKLEDQDLGEDGRKLFILERATLLHAVQRSSSKAQRPQTAREIICGNDPDIKKDIEKLTANGEIMWEKLRKNAIQRLLAQKHLREHNGGR